LTNPPQILRFAPGKAGAMDVEARNEIVLLRAKLLGLREIVAHLLSAEASRADDPEGFLKDLFEKIDTKIAAVANEMTSPSMHLEEATRKEVDWVIATARAALNQR
jgi:predicted RNA-binding Zn ribbon-like protein